MSVRRPSRRLVFDVIAAALFLCGTGLIGYAAVSHFTTPPPGAAPVLAGLTATAEPAGGHEYRAVLRLKNEGRWPLEVVGGTWGCRFGGCADCDGPARFPLAPGGSAELTIAGDRWRPGPFEETIDLYVAHADALHTLPVTIAGTLPDADGAFMDDARYARLSAGRDRK